VTGGGGEEGDRVKERALEVHMKAICESSCVAPLPLCRSVFTIAKCQQSQLPTLFFIFPAHCAAMTGAKGVHLRKRRTELMYLRSSTGAMP
jgi:hypothetical protein